MSKSEPSGSSNEQKQPSEPSSEDEDFSCFGEYGSRVKCPTCKQCLTCKNFTHEKQEAIYKKKTSKYKGKGHWSRKDLY